MHALLESLVRLILAREDGSNATRLIALVIAAHIREAVTPIVLDVATAFGHSSPDQTQKRAGSLLAIPRDPLR